MSVAALTEQQKETRRSGIGASEIAALVGLNPDKKPIDIYRAKVEGLEDGEDSEPAEWGRRLEDPVARRYADRHGLAIFASGADPADALHLANPRTTYRSMKHPIALATPDRFVMAGEVVARLVQIKTTGWWRRGEWTATEVPDRCLAQVQWELGVCTCEEKRNDLVVLIAGQQYREYAVTFDPDMFGALYEHAARFWRDHVQKKVPPPLDASASSEAYLERAFPRSLGNDIEATEEDEHLIARYRAAEARAEEEEEIVRALENRIKARIGAHDGMWGIGWRAAWKSNERGNVAWKRVAEELRRIADIDATTFDRITQKHRGVPARPFSVKFDKEGAR